TGGKLKLSSREPRAVNRCSKPTKIPVTEYRGIQNIDRLVIETLEDCARKVVVRIDDQVDRPGFSSRIITGRTEYRYAAWANDVRRTIIWRRKRQDDGLRTEGRHDVAHVDVPPISAQCQAFDPFRTVNSSVSPLIRYFWMDSGVTQDSLLDLWL